MAVVARPRPIPSDAEIAMRLQLEELGVDGGAMSAADVAALTALVADAAFAQQLALAEAGLSAAHLSPQEPAGPRGRRAGGGSSSGAGCGAGSASAAAADGGPRRVCCGICLDRVSAIDMTPCGGVGCGHAFCTPCLRGHVASRIADRRYPVPCADGTCTSRLPYEVCAALVAGTGNAEVMLARLHIQTTFMSSRSFCANPACGTPFDFEIDAEAIRRVGGVAHGDGHRAAGGDGARPRGREPVDLYRVDCPLCATSTCVRCRVAWHADVTCAAHQKEVEANDQLRALAKLRQWKACPGCGELIDKAAGDCNFVRHEACGTGFCFHCGRAYEHQRPTPRNSHGKPACQCGLCNYADEEEDDARVVGDGVNEAAERRGAPRAAAPRFGERDDAPPVAAVRMRDPPPPAERAGIAGGVDLYANFLEYLEAEAEWRELERDAVRRGDANDDHAVGLVLRSRAEVPLDLVDLVSMVHDGVRRLPNGIMHDLQTCTFLSHVPPRIRVALGARRAPASDGAARCAHLLWPPVYVDAGAGAAPAG